MKDLGLMHYFLGLEVCQNPEGMFTNQRKYAMEILKIFDMLECKSMATPMDTNLKLLSNESSELVDVTRYIHNYWVTDVSDGYWSRYMLCCEHSDSISS